MKKHNKKNLLVKRYLKRKLRFQKITKTFFTSDAYVQPIGDMSVWDKLPIDIRTMVKEGVKRLSYLRNVIGAEARLPMPPIRIVPIGWWIPETGVVIYGQVRPVLVKDSFQWGTIIPASTLVIVDDDTILRRILCHEFAHCFWYITRIIKELKDGEWINKDITVKAPTLEIVKEQTKKDKEELIDPAEWFGEWDIKNFLFEGGQPLRRTTEMFAEYWIKAGLPAEPPNMIIDVNGTVGIEDEVVEHIRHLDGKLSFGKNR